MSLLKTKSALVLGLAGIGGLTTAQTASADEVKPVSRTTDKVGHLDVSVDDQSLRDAISLAESQGVQVFRMKRVFVPEMVTKPRNTSKKLRTTTKNALTA